MRVVVPFVATRPFIRLIHLIHLFNLPSLPAVNQPCSGSLPAVT